MGADSSLESAGPWLWWMRQLRHGLRRACSIYIKLISPGPSKSFNRHNQPLGGGGVSHTVAWAAGAVVGGPVSSRGTFNEGLFKYRSNNSQVTVRRTLLSYQAEKELPSANNDGTRVEARPTAVAVQSLKSNERREA